MATNQAPPNADIAMSPVKTAAVACLSACKKRCADVEACLERTAEKEARLTIFDDTKRAALHANKALTDMLKQGKEAAEQQAAREAELQTELEKVEAAVAIMRVDFSEERACYSVQVDILRCLISALEMKGGLEAFGGLRELLGTLLDVLPEVAGEMSRGK